MQKGRKPEPRPRWPSGQTACGASDLSGPCPAAGNNDVPLYVFASRTWPGRCRAVVLIQTRRHWQTNKWLHSVFFCGSMVPGYESARSRDPNQHPVPVVDGSPGGAGRPYAAGEARFLSHTRQLTFEGRRSGEGYFSPDGRSLIFQSEREPGNPFYQIYILDLEGGDSRRISPGTGKTTCAFFRPHRDEVLFASTHLDPESAAKQKAELQLRASGKERRYAWDYDEHFDIWAARS